MIWPKLAGQGDSQGAGQLGHRLLGRVDAGDGGQGHGLAGQVGGQARHLRQGLVDQGDGVDDDVAAGGGNSRGALAAQHRHQLVVGGGQRRGPDGLELGGRQHLRQLTGDEALGGIGDRDGRDTGLGRQRSPQPGLEIELGEQLVRGARRHGGGHRRILEDGRDRADKCRGVEQGPVRPHLRGGQQHQQAGQRDQQADDTSADAPPARLLDSFFRFDCYRCHCDSSVRIAGPVAACA